ncbi:MAG: hypothetical protein IKU06_11925 [Lachnospiraceae bacterium]|nr:hypothetical protein [Lachnospiraceae bacterium]
MKTWSNAEIVELEIKSTYNDQLMFGNDGTFEGEDLIGTPPDESGNIGTGTYYGNVPSMDGNN